LIIGQDQIESTLLDCGDKIVACFNARDFTDPPSSLSLSCTSSASLLLSSR
jgi:hypothetical protein